MAAPDDFAPYTRGLAGPYERAAAVTPSDADDLAFQTLAIWVGGTGNLAVEMADGNDVTLTSVPAGTELRLRANKVLSTGTTATAIVALG